MQTTKLPTTYYGDGADNDHSERLAHEALGDREKQRQADALRNKLLGLR